MRKVPVIVSMTSWPARINHVAFTVYMMLSQTVRPDKIIINLSQKEFPNKLRDLPKELVNTIYACKEVEIVWHNNNTRAFKKVIPTIMRYKNIDCWVISVDDDWQYSNTYVANMVSYAEESPFQCITPGDWGLWPQGYAMIYNPIWFRNELLWKYSQADADTIIASDWFIWANLFSNGITMRAVPEIKHLIKPMICEKPLGNVYGNVSKKQRAAYISGWMKKHGFNKPLQWPLLNGIKIN